jgi:hypothetical protein
VEEYAPVAGIIGKKYRKVNQRPRFQKFTAFSTIKRILFCLAETTLIASSKTNFKSMPTNITSNNIFLKTEIMKLALELH